MKQLGVFLGRGRLLVFFSDADGFDRTDTLCFRRSRVMCCIVKFSISLLTLTIKRRVSKFGGGAGRHETIEILLKSKCLSAFLGQPRKSRCRLIFRTGSLIDASHFQRQHLDTQNGGWSIGRSCCCILWIGYWLDKIWYRWVLVCLWQRFDRFGVPSWNMDRSGSRGVEVVPAVVLAVFVDEKKVKSCQNACRLCTYSSEMPV